jgi:hypothetical protein
VAKKDAFESIDWGDLIQKLSPYAMQMLKVLLDSLLNKKGTPKPESAVGCDDNDEEALDCALHCQVHALAALIKLKECCAEEDNGR